MIAYLDAYSYDAAGGIHWYGRIVIPARESIDAGRLSIEVKRILSRKEAAALNKDDRQRGDSLGPLYEPGDETIKFRTREQLISAAIGMLDPKVKVLVFGRSSILEPQEVVYGPEPFKSEMNKLVAEAEAINWWEGGNEAAMNDIISRYEGLLRDLK